MGKESVCIVGSGNWWAGTALNLFTSSQSFWHTGISFSLPYVILSSLIRKPRRGSAISKIAGRNILNNPHQFEKRLPMWVFEETLDEKMGGGKLTDVINEKHENVK
jgi:hypothetical protein